MRINKRPTADKKEVIDDITPFGPILSSFTAEKGLNAKTKAKAIKEWWKVAKMPHKTNAIVAGDNESCETHTGITRKNSRYLNLEILEGKLPFEVPPAHQEMYLAFHEQIQKDHLIVLSKAIRFITLRQMGEQFFVYIQTSPARQAMGKQIKKFAEWIERHHENIRGVFILYSPQDRRFSTSSPQRDLPVEYKKMVGPESLLSKIGDHKYFYHPLEYYRPNQALLPELVDSVAKQLVLKKDETLIDLYSGGGFFSEMLAHMTLNSVAVDIRKISKTSFKLNQDRNTRKNIQFLETDIHAATFAEVLPTKIKGPAKFLINPPIGVLPAPVMSVVALQSPERIVRIYQNPEDLQKEIRKWKRLGYIIQKCIPFDSFHHTSRLELLVTLSPDRNEVLKNKSKKSTTTKTKTEDVILFKQ